MDNIGGNRGGFGEGEGVF